MERAQFLERFLARPGTIGSVTPSSVYLAQKMVKAVEVCACRNIVELGAGTGVFTRALVEWKRPDCRLCVFETDPALAEGLREKFPWIELYPDASALEDLLEAGALEQADLVVSGLPFTVLPDAMRRKILRGVHRVLRPGGKFVAFLYSFNLLQEFERIYASVDLEYVLLNIPPAVVYRCTKANGQDQRFSMAGGELRVV